MSKRAFGVTWLLGLLIALYVLPASAQVPQQCVTNALAGGTADALTVPLLPCGLATNILQLTLAASNATTSPTLQMAGFPALPIHNSGGGAIAVGDLPGAGYIVQLAGTGTDWRLIANGKIIGSSVSSLSFGTTGLTPSTATTGAIVVAGDLVVANGGTGVTTLTGLAKGNGTSPFTAATAGTDYCAPGVTCTWTAQQVFAGTSSNLALSLVNGREPASISATAATGTINYDICSQSIVYYTASASANWTVNFRCSSGTALNTAMSTGDVVTVTFLVTQGATPYYNSAITVDGTSVTPKYQGGTAWSAGNASGVDAYTYAITKTGSAAWTIFASQTQFK